MTSDPAFDFNNFTAFTFESANPTYPYKSCAVVWFGHILPGGAIGQPRNPLRNAELTVYPSIGWYGDRDGFVKRRDLASFMDSGRQQCRHPQRVDFDDRGRVHDSITGWHWSLRSYAARRALRIISCPRSTPDLFHKKVQGRGQ